MPPEAIMGVAAERGIAKKFHGTKRDVKLDRKSCDESISSYPEFSLSEEIYFSDVALTHTLLSLVSTTDYSKQWNRSALGECIWFLDHNKPIHIRLVENIGAPTE